MLRTNVDREPGADRVDSSTCPPRHGETPAASFRRSTPSATVGTWASNRFHLLHRRRCWCRPSSCAGSTAACALGCSSFACCFALDERWCRRLRIPRGSCPRDQRLVDSTPAIGLGRSPSRRCLRRRCASSPRTWPWRCGRAGPTAISSPSASPTCVSRRDGVPGRGRFVPFLNLVRPKQIVDDIWRATDGEPARWSWRSAPVDASIHAWWAFLVASLFLATRPDIDEFDRGTVQLGLLRCGMPRGLHRARLARDVPADLPVGFVGGAAWHPGAPGGHPSDHLGRRSSSLGRQSASASAPSSSFPRVRTRIDVRQRHRVGDCFGIPGATATPTPGQTRSRR